MNPKTTSSIIRPSKLMLLTSDPSLQDTLQAKLEDPTEANYRLRSTNAVEQLEDFALGTMCHVLLIDLREPEEALLRFILHVEKQGTPVATIGICHSDQDAEEFDKTIRHVVDYIYIDKVSSRELRSRIDHSIHRTRRAYRNFKEAKLLHSLLKHIPDSIYFKDRESRFIKVSESLAKDYGHGVNDLTGKSDADLFNAEDAKPAYEDEQRIIQTGEPIIGKIEKRITHTGEVRYVSTTKLPLYDALDNIYGTMGISRNITELRNAEKQLAEGQSLLDTIINNPIIGIFVKDQDGRYLICNSTHTSYLGASESGEVIGKTIHDFFDKDKAAQIATEEEVIMAQSSDSDGIHVKVVKASDDSHRLLSKVPLLDEDGTCRGLVGISFNISAYSES